MKVPLDYPFQQFSIAVNVSAEELDRPSIIRGPWWRDMLVSVGLLRPIYGPTLREQMAMMKEKQQQQMQRMQGAMKVRLFGDRQGY